MTLDLILRFLAGGAFVSLFAVLGDSFKPKTFAGLFGAAPSIALAGFLIVRAKQGAPTAVVEARSMIAGAVAMLAYSATCAWLLRRSRIAPWVLAGALWIEWMAVAFLLYGAFLR